LLLLLLLRFIKYEKPSPVDHHGWAPACDGPANVVNINHHDPLLLFARFAMVRFFLPPRIRIQQQTCTIHNDTSTFTIDPLHDSSHHTVYAVVRLL
jgi:hypothetical protein